MWVVSRHACAVFRTCLQKIGPNKGKDWLQHIGMPVSKLSLIVGNGFSVLHDLPWVESKASGVFGGEKQASYQYSTSSGENPKQFRRSGEFSP